VKQQLHAATYVINNTIPVCHCCVVLYSLDPEQKDMLIEVIEKLLADKTTVISLAACLFIPV